MIFLTTPGSGDLLNFVKAAQRTSGKQGLEHIGFKVTPPELRELAEKIQENSIKIEGRRGKTAFYITRPQGLPAGILLRLSASVWRANLRSQNKLN